MTWKDVTTEKYIQIENIYNTDNDIIDKTVAIISIIADENPKLLPAATSHIAPKKTA